MNQQTQQTAVPVIKGVEGVVPQQYPNKLAVIIKDKKITLQQVQKGIFKDGKMVREGTGISYPVLIDFKKGGRNNFEQRTIRQIAEFLEVSPEELMGTYQSPKMVIKQDADDRPVRKSKKKLPTKKAKKRRK